MGAPPGGTAARGGGASAGGGAAQEGAPIVIWYNTWGYDTCISYMLNMCFTTRGVEPAFLSITCIDHGDRVHLRAQADELDNLIAHCLVREIATFPA